MHWENSCNRFEAESNLAYHDEIHAIPGVQWVINFDFGAEQFIASIEITDEIDRDDEKRIKAIEPRSFPTIPDAKRWCEEIENGRPCSEPDYTDAVNDVLSVLRQPDMMKIMEMSGITKASLARDIAAGVAKGFPVEKQVEIAKEFLGKKGNQDEKFLAAVRAFCDR